MDTYIERLSLKNVGKFDSLNVKFNPRVNVIIGANGTGKTSILRGICNCMSMSMLENVRNRQGASYNLYCSLNGKKYLIGADGVVNTDQEYHKLSIAQWRIHSEEGYESVIMHQSQTYHLLSIGAYRYFTYQQMQGMQREAPSLERQNQYIQNNAKYIDSTAMPNIKQWMINRYFVVDKPWATTEKANWDKLNDKLVNIAPQGANFKFLRIERALEPIFLLNGQECFLEELSSGYKSVLSILFTIIDWIEGVNDGDNALIDKAKGTVLIDEIDVHLHPTWQQTILSSLRDIFPNIQFIVTTHSPHVVMSAKQGEVILINTDTRDLDIEPVSSSFEYWQSKDVLQDLMNTYDMASLESLDIMKGLNSALDRNDIEEYDALLRKLENLLHPSDSILRYYHISRSKIILSNDTDNKEA